MPIKYPKPKILMIDMDKACVDAIVGAGYNVSEGQSWLTTNRLIKLPPTAIAGYPVKGRLVDSKKEVASS